MKGMRFPVFALGLLIPLLLTACAAHSPEPQESRATSAAFSVPPSSAAVSSAEASSVPPPSSKPASGPASSSGRKAVPSPSEQIAALRCGASVSQFEVSHHSAQIAVIRKTGDEMRFSVIDTKSGQETVVPSISGNLYDPKWSFDDKYLIVEEGTANLHTSHLLTAATLGEKAAFKVTAAIWAPSCEFLAVSRVNKLRPTVDMELDGTTDIFLINADTLGETLLLKADADTLYTPEKWDGVNLYVRKSSLTSGKSETVRVEALSAALRPVQSKP